MLNKLTVSLAALATVGFVGSAMAGAVPESSAVAVNINVLEEVSLWAGVATVPLTLSGANAENSDAFASSLNHINNTDAAISVNVTGTLPGSLGNEVNFFIFDDQAATLGESGAISAIAANSNAPAGALVFNQAGGLGVDRPFASVTVSPSVTNRKIVYAAAAPNFLPAPGSIALTATWTITDATP